MELQPIFGTALRISIMILAFNLGLNISLQEKMYLLLRPKTILLSLFSMLIIMPVVAVVLCKAFQLPPVAKMALIAMSVSPIPATLPQKEIKAGGEADYAYTLLFSAVIVSVLTIPMSIGIIDNFFDQTVDVSALELIKVLIKSIFLPVSVGIFVKIFARKIADKIKVPLIKVASFLLQVSLVGILIVSWRIVISIVDSLTLIAIILYCLLAIIAGHVLGGPTKEHRTVLAFSTLSRHPGIAIAISSILFPGDIGIKATILVFLIVSTIMAKLYETWLERHNLAVSNKKALT